MFNCSHCGYITFKWLGRCPECGAWESFIEEKKEQKKKTRTKDIKLINLKDIVDNQEQRISTGIKEFD
ncbi:DNA repair protein RadA, partial [Candidatus Omnitrophota bacterium]